MSGYVLVGREIEGRSEPEPIGIAYLDDDDCRAVTGIVGMKKGICIRGIDETDYTTLKEVGLTEWTARQIIGSDEEPEVDPNA